MNVKFYLELKFNTHNDLMDIWSEKYIYFNR